MITVAILTEMEVNAAIVTSSLPDIKKLVRRLLTSDSSTDRRRWSPTRTLRPYNSKEQLGTPDSMTP